MDKVNSFLAKSRGFQSSGIFRVIREKDFLVIWFLQFAVFLFLMLCYTFGFMMLPKMCILLSAHFLMGAGMLWSLQKKAPVFLPLSLLMPFAVLAGSVLGLYTYDVYACFPMFYQNARIYTDVVPSQPSAAVADAGKIMFSPASFVDRNQSVSFVTERGSTFCVAPVRDASMPPKIEFWAVGLDCCNAEGGFWCDDSTDPKADGGAIVFDNTGIFSSSRYDEYSLARKKAEATFRLVSTEQPVYVRWVKSDNLDFLSHEYRNKAILCLFGWAFLYSSLSGGLTYAVYKPRRPEQPVGF